jgi:hypothetical protein
VVSHVKGRAKTVVFENRVLRRIFVSKINEVTREWRKLHSEELHNLYSSKNIIRQIKSRRMMWVGHVACMGEERSVQGFGVNVQKKVHLEDRGKDMGSEEILRRLAGGRGYVVDSVGSG